MSVSGAEDEVLSALLHLYVARYMSVSGAEDEVLSALLHLYVARYMSVSYQLSAFLHLGREQGLRRSLHVSFISATCQLHVWTRHRSFSLPPPWSRAGGLGFRV